MGGELLQHGYTVEQVVHDYGDLCQAITDLAIEKGEPIGVDEFRTLNRCLDNAMADAVMEFSSKRDLDREDTQMQAFNQKLQFLTHEMSNHLSGAMLALKAMKTGKVGLNGATGDVLGRSLMGLRELLDGALAGIHITAGPGPADRLFPVDPFIAEIELSASLLAEIGHCQLSILIRGTDLALMGNRDMLKSAVINLLQNAFKFTAPGTTVQLNVYPDRERIRIQVLDRCGGLPPGTGGAAVHSLHAAARRQVRHGPGPGHQQADRAGQPRRHQCPQPRGHGLRIHHRPSTPHLARDRSG